MGQDDQSTPAAINDAGQVAYTADDEEPSREGTPFIFLFNKGRSICLGPGTATGINQFGSVSGYVVLDRYRKPVVSPAEYGFDPDAPSPAVSYALLCQPRYVKRTLGLGYALNVNDSSNAIGISTDMTLGYKGWNVAGAEAASRVQVANVLAAQGAEKLKTTLSGPEVLWRTGHGRSRTVPLPFHWLPQAINDRGWIVGSHFLWARGRQYDLNTLIGRTKDWKIVCGTASRAHFC